MTQTLDWPHGADAARRPSADRPTRLGHGLRVALVSNDLDYLASFRGPVVASLLERGARVTVIAPPGAGNGASIVTGMGAELAPWRLRKTGRNPFRDLGALYALRRAVSAARPDILYADTIKPVLYSLLVGAALRAPRRVVMLPGLGYAFIDGKGLARRLTRTAAMLAYGAMLPLADRVIFHNGDDAAFFLDHGMVRDSARVALVDGSGVDLDAFPQRPLPPGPPVFLMIARLLHDKGVLEYVEAARRFRRKRPDARFWLAGGLDPNPAAISREQVSAWEAAGDIEYFGQVKDVRPLLEACHAFVLPSYREGLPRTCLEAMAVGRAIVTSDAPGCREVVAPGVNGELAPPRDAAALAAAMERVARDAGVLERMGQASRRMCERRFALPIVTERMTALLLGEV